MSKEDDQLAEALEASAVAQKSIDALNITYAARLKAVIEPALAEIDLICAHSEQLGSQRPPIVNQAYNLANQLRQVADLCNQGIT